MRERCPSAFSIVDDHPLTRDALASLLAAGGFDVVGEAADGAAALELARTLCNPIWCCSTFRCPASTGSAALPRLRAAAPGCEVVVLTASGTEENLLAAIRGGAAGYLLKSEPPERIIEFLRGVANGEAALSGEVARRLLDQLRTADGSAAASPTSIAEALSAREVEVLLLLDEHLSTDDDREAAVHLGAHRALAREEPASQARRLVAPRRARAARRRAALARHVPYGRKALVRGGDEPRQRRQVVAALEHRGESGRERRTARRQLAEPRRRHLHRGQRILARARRSRPRRAGGRARTRAPPARPCSRRPRGSRRRRSRQAAAG